MKFGIFQNKSKFSIWLNTDLGRVFTLIFVSLAIGIYLIATTVLVTRDAVGYVQEAKKFTFADFSSLYWPGLTSVIFLTHSFLQLFFEDSNHLWIYAGQIMSLIFKTGSAIVLYYLGKKIVGARLSFFAVIILLFLPYPAQFGSDILRDWSAVFFICLSVLFLFEWVYKLKIYFFVLSVITSGIGLLFKPEASQGIVYAFFLTAVIIFKTRPNINKKAVLLSFLVFIVLLSSFSYFLYSYKGGKYLPQKLKSIIENETINRTEPTTAKEGFKRAVSSFGTIFERVSENLIYFFVPFAFLGIWNYFGKNKFDNQYFYIGLFYIIFICFNILILSVVNYKWGYVSRRHCMPLVVFLIFFVPNGIMVASRFATSKLNGYKNLSIDTLTYIIVAAGIMICLAKLFVPMGWDKRNYLLASNWLEKFTPKDCVVAVADSRIGYYSNRAFLTRKDKDVLICKADYYAIIVKKNQVDNEYGSLIKCAEFDNNKGGKIKIFQKRFEQ